MVTRESFGMAPKSQAIGEKEKHVGIKIPAGVMWFEHIFKRRVAQGRGPIDFDTGEPIVWPSDEKDLSIVMYGKKVGVFYYFLI